MGRKNAIWDLKSYTSTQLKKSIKENIKESRREWIIWMMERAEKKNKRNSGFQLWQQHNHPVELSTKEMMDRRLEYIHNNPLEAGFVDDLVRGFGVVVLLMKGGLKVRLIWFSLRDYRADALKKLGFIYYTNILIT